MKKAVVFLSLILCIYAVPLAQAELVTVWSVDVVASFDEDSLQWDGGTGTFVDATHLLWGTDIGNGQSGLTINNPTTTQISTNGAAVDNVSLTAANNPITGASLESVLLASTLTLTPFLPALPGLPPAVLTFQINYLETPNSPQFGICADGTINGVGLNSNGCADIFAIDQDALNFPFQYDTDGDGGEDALTYYISFFENTNGLNPLSAAACSAVFGGPCATPVLGFLTPESQDTKAIFAALITSKPVDITPVPEPSTLILLGFGLAGIGLLKRRRG
jgi:hypothetical protein